MVKIPAPENPPIILKYKIDDQFFGNFDELQNITVSNRKSDVGFTDQKKMMIRMRPGTTQTGNTITGGSGTSTTIFYTDRARVRRQFRGYNSKIWYLNGSTWTDTGMTDFASNDFHFNVINLPLNLDGSTPTTYTSPNDAESAEKVKVAGADPGFGIAGVNVGKILMIMDDTAGGQSYRGAFATIINNDGNQYTLQGSGLITPIKSGCTYKVYESMGAYLQVTDNGGSFDRYLNGVTEHTPFAGYATLGLRTVRAITSTQYVTMQTSFNNVFWTFDNGTLFYSTWVANNPFLFDFTGAYTLPVSGTILQVFNFKKRLIVGGSNFIICINQNLTYNIISASYGIKLNSLVDLGEDMYFLSSDKQLYSLTENIAGNIIPTNIAKNVLRYFDDFNTNICAWFDGRKMFMYGQIDSQTPGRVLVLDIPYKYWATYTGLRPSSIVTEQSITYITDNNSDKVRYFDSTVFTDLGQPILQKIAIKEIDLWDIFQIKILKFVHIWLDNYDQDMSVDVLYSLANKNTSAPRKDISIKEVSVANTSSPSMGEWVQWENIMGGKPFTDRITYPNIKEVDYNIEKAYVWKVILSGKGGSPFYLNEVDVTMELSGGKRRYFSPQNTI